MLGYQEQTAATRERGSEFVELHLSLQTARMTMMERIDAIEKICHRVQNTNYPKPEPTQKDPSPICPPEGLLTNIQHELSLINQGNQRLLELEQKLDKLF